MGDRLILKSKQLLADINDKRSKCLQSLNVPPCLEDKIHSLLEKKSSLETNLLSFHQQQMILKELEMPPEQMLTIDKLDAETVESDEILSEATAVHQQNLLKMEATKRMLLEAMDHLNSSIHKLSQKIEMLENKYASIELDGQEADLFNQGKLNPTAYETAKERIYLLSKNVEEEKQLMEDRVSRLNALLQLVDRAAVCVESETESRLKLNTLQDKLSGLEVLSGIKCTVIDDQTVSISFVDQGSQRLQEYSKLVITLSFALDENLCLELANVETNLKFSEVQTILQDARNDKDLPKLIRNLRKSWLSYIPLLKEISSLRECHAIDWNAEDRALHLMIGKCVVCRLSIPPSYPYGKGAINLDQITGASMSEESIVAPDDLSITGWVTHLENIFGKS